MKILTNILFAFLLLYSTVYAQPKPEDSANPILPGYFADPTIKKFGDTYYIYSTTDGVKLASGEPTVWISKDLRNWYNKKIDIKLPQGLTNCWAPDVVEGDNGKYYYYMGNCQFGCNIYGYESDNPLGPWYPINDGKPVIPVGTGLEHLPALDAQFFKDGGELYSYFGTWCTTFKGLGWAKIDANDMHTIEKEGSFPISDLPDVFEAAYLFKHNDVYILMYSSGDCRLGTYAVHYCWGETPVGPWNYGKNNPILETTADGFVDSPGHHSILEKDGEHYIFYHRHDNPHSSGGMYRQVCVNPIKFEDKHTIAKIDPYEEVDFESKTPKNLALDAEASASSSYRLTAPANKFTRKDVDYTYNAENVLDNNNGTMWKAASCELPQSITIKLDKETYIKRIFTEFEYSTFYYQYKIETSTDGKLWSTFVDRTKNQIPGIPMIDEGDAKANQIKITITGTQKAGMLAAIWNVKVYDELFDIPQFENEAINEPAGSTKSKGLLVDMNAHKAKVGKIENTGLLGGKFIEHGSPKVSKVDGVSSIEFDGQSFLELSKEAPKSLDWNSPFTVTAWVYVDELQEGAGVVAWNSRDNMLQSSYAAMIYGTGNYGAIAHGDALVDIPYKEVPKAKQWHNITLTFDGMKEQVYVDGNLQIEMPISLFVKSSKIFIGSTGAPHEHMKGNIARVQIYDYTMSNDDVQKLIKQTKPKGL